MKKVPAKSRPAPTKASAKKRKNEPKAVLTMKPVGPAKPETPKASQKKKGTNTPKAAPVKKPASTAKPQTPEASQKKKGARKEVDAFAMSEPAEPAPDAARRPVVSFAANTEESVYIADDTTLKNLFDHLNTNTRIASVIQAITGRAQPERRKCNAGNSETENILDTTESKHKLVAELVNLLCRACGSAVDIQPWQISESPDETLEEVFNRIDDESPAAYVLGGNDTAHRFFRRNFAVLWKALIASFSLSDMDALLESLLPWLAAMTESKSRAFRHTASVAAFGIATGVLQALAGQEKAKRPTQSEHTSSLRSAVSDIYTKIYSRRVRDVHQPVRALSLETLVEWIAICPSTYVKPDYTKNFGFLLHDKAPEIRKSALDAVAVLYGERMTDFDGVGRFTDRFRERILEQTRDSDPSCVESALKVCAQMLQFDAAKSDSPLTVMYPEESLNLALRTIFDEKASVRQAAGALFDAVLKVNTAGYEVDERKGKRLEMLLRFVKESRENRCIENAAWYVVDAVMSADVKTGREAKRRKGPRIFDMGPNVLLESYADLFTFCTQSSSDVSLVQGATALISALSSYVRAKIPKDDGETDHIRAAFDADSLLSFVAQSLKLHGSLPDIAPIIVGVLNTLEVKEINPENADLPPVVETLAALFQQSSDYAQLRPIAQFLEKISPMLSTFRQPVRESISSLTHDVTEKALQGADAAHWRRAHALYRVTDLREIRPHALTILTKFVKNFATFENLEGEVAAIQPVIGCVYRSCFWAVRASADEQSQKESLNSVIAEVRDLFLRMLSLLIEKLPAQAVELFCAVCDLFVAQDISIDTQSTASLSSAYFTISDTLLKKHTQIAAKRQTDMKKKSPEGYRIEQLSKIAAAAQRELLTVQNELARMTAGVSRLVHCGRVSLSGIAEVLPLWPRMPEKFLSDSLKEMFRLGKSEILKIGESRVFPELSATHDRFARSVDFELEIIHNGCAHVRANDARQEVVQDFQNLCTRLAQTHFMPQTDANYRAVVAIAKKLLGEVAEDPTSNAALLCAVAPYASRLRAEHAKEITADFIEKDLEKCPEYFRALFVRSIRRRVPVASQAAAAELTNDSIDLMASDQLATSETLLATPIPLSISQRQHSEMSLRELSLGADSTLFDMATPTGQRSAFRDLSIGQSSGFFQPESMETFLGTDEQPTAPSQALTDTVPRPSQRSERSSLIIGDDSSEVFVESQIFV